MLSQIAIWRNTKEMEQSTIKGLIDSGIREWKTLDNDPSRYSTGWWKRLRYFNRSIGGQTDPSIQDMAEAINDRYWRRAEWLGILFLGFAYFGGKLAKRYRKAKEYEVLHETFEPDQGTGEE